MKKVLSLRFDVNMLAKSPQKSEKVCELLKELEKKGFLNDGKVVYNEEQEAEVKEIINRYLLDK